MDPYNAIVESVSRIESLEKGNADVLPAINKVIKILARHRIALSKDLSQNGGHRQIYDKIKAAIVERDRNSHFRLALAKSINPLIEQITE